MLFDNQTLRTIGRCTLQYPTLETLLFSSSCTAHHNSSLEERTIATGSLSHLFRVDKFV